MLAKRVSELPSGGDWIFEPKWDGFRALVFRDGDEIFIQSRDEKPLNRYFPDLLAPLRSALPAQCVLDGEIVIVKDDGLTSTVCNLVFTRPPHAFAFCLSKVRHRSYSSTCSVKESATSRLNPSKRGVTSSKECSPPPRRRFISRRQQRMRTLHQIGLAASKARGSTV